MRIRLLLVATLLCAGCGDDAPEVAPGVDAQVVGKWRATYKAPRLVTDSYMNLYPDGRYEFSTRSESSVPGTTTQLGPVTRGTWKAEGGRLYYTLEGQGQWIEAGTYTLSGRNSMVVAPPGGLRVLWERTD